MMEHQWYYYLSDTFLYAVAKAAVTDFKVLSMLLSGPVIWAISKFTDWTPWTTDDKLDEMIKEKLGLKE